MLRIEDLTKRYATGDLALENVSLSVPRGQVMGLIGPSGASWHYLYGFDRNFCISRFVEPGNYMLHANRSFRWVGLDAPEPYLGAYSYLL